MIKGGHKLQTETEIKKRVKLSLDDYTINPESIGWARNLISTCNVRVKFLRKKKWNYWCVYGREALFSATISHLDYASVCFVYYFDYETKDYFEKTIIIPLDRKTVMPDEVQETVEVSHKQMNLSFISTESETVLKVRSNNFDGKKLDANITVSYPDDIDSLNVVVPWSKKHYQFTAKHHCLPADGYVTIGEKTYTFHPETDYGVLDYGRGIWPRKSTWNWGMASGNLQDDVIGLNFGGKWTDNTGSTENAVILNGEIFKISEDVQFVFDKHDYMKDWEVVSESGNVQLTFTPIFERIAKTNVVIIHSEVHQMVGHYHGKIVLSDGREIVIDSLLGCIEDHYAKW